MEINETLKQNEAMEKLNVIMWCGIKLFSARLTVPRWNPEYYNEAYIYKKIVKEDYT